MPASHGMRSARIAVRYDEAATFGAQGFVQLPQRSKNELNAAVLHLRVRMLNCAFTHKATVEVA